MPLLHFQPVLCCVGSQSYGSYILGCWWNCTDWLSWAWQHHDKNLLCWSDQKNLGSIEGEEMSEVALRVLLHDNAPAHTSSQALAVIRIDSNYFTTHHITRFGSTWVICLLTRNAWQDATLLTTKMLSAWQMAGWKSKINSSSTMESELWRNAGTSAFHLQETMLKRDKIWCTYYGINCYFTNTLHAYYGVTVPHHLVGRPRQDRP